MGIKVVPRKPRKTKPRRKKQEDHPSGWAKTPKKRKGAKVKKLPYYGERKKTRRRSI
tara:strand:- start:100 stop:270 length:171 start_codon:yes stop_codon:yes gene_type:complete